ncbi:hypothetical protein ACOMHN_017565 [Nucella lapillus]
MGYGISRPFHSTTNPDTRVRQAVEFGQWEAVAKWLGQCGEDTQRWVLEEASQKAEDEQLKALVVTCCPEDQLTTLMTRAIGRALWGTVAQLIQQPHVSENLRSKAVDKASKCDNEDHFIQCFLPHCPEPCLGSVLETMITRGFWEGAVRILRQGIDDVTREWAIAKVSEHANETAVLSVLKFCTAARRKTLLEQSAHRRFWTVVTVLLETEIHHPRRGEIVETASQHASEDELFQLVPHCEQGELNTVFVLSVMRGFWRLVGSFLEQGVTEDRRQWALEEASRRADYHDLKEYILPRHRYQHVLSTVNIHRRLPDPVQMLMRTGGVSDTVLSQVIIDVSKCDFIEHALHLLKGLSSEQFLSLVSEFIKFRMDSNKLVKIVSQQQGLEKVYQLIPFWGRVFVQSLRVVETQPQEPMNDFNWLVLFHTGLAELCVSHVESIHQRERDDEQVFRGLMTDWTRSAQSHCSKESFEIGVTEQVIEDIFIQCLYRRHNEGAFMSGIRCVLALQSLSPTMQKLGQENLREVWEEVRRSVFKTAVEQKDWAVVKKMADHSLYDDQRGWATVQALDDGQWDTVLALSRHGMTDDQLYRVHRQFAKRADWPSVLKLFQSGADLTHVREDLAMANECRERPPRPEVVLKHWQRVQQLKDLEDSVAKEAESLSEVVKRNNWQAVLFRLRIKSSQRQRSKVVQIAIRRQVWYVVPYIIRMGVSQAEKDALFPQCISLGQWSTVRLLMEYLVDPSLLTEAFDVMLQQRQWILVAMVMDLTLDDVRRTEVMRTAMEEHEGSVVAHGLTLLEGRLSVEERKQLFFKAHRKQLWQVLRKLSEEKDSTGRRHRDVTLREAVWRHQWDVVTHCQESGADIDAINARTGIHETLLNRAAIECDWEVVHGLIQLGADQSIEDSTGNRVIHRAMDLYHWETVHLLVLFHADLTFLDPHEGRSALYKLIKSTAPSPYASPPTVAAQGRIIDKCLIWCCDVDYEETFQGKNALHVTSHAGLWETFRSLVARGSNPLARTVDGQTLLWMAAENIQCPHRMVAECIKLGISTFEQEFNQSNFSTTPFGLSLLRQDHVLMSMLYESGSCSNSEVFWHLQNTLRTSHARGSHLLTSTRSLRGNLPPPVIVKLLTKQATQPRTLKSLCRLRVSHLLGVQHKREKRVAELPLSYQLKHFVMFIDITNPDFARTVQESLV